MLVCPEVADRWRRFRLARIFHVTPSVIDEESAVEMDWALAFDQMLAEKERDDAARHEGSGY